MSIYVGLKRTLTEIQYESTQILTTALESAHDRNGLLQGTLMWYYDVILWCENYWISCAVIDRDKQLILRYSYLAGCNYYICH